MDHKTIFNETLTFTISYYCDLDVEQNGSIPDPKSLSLVQNCLRKLRKLRPPPKPLFQRLSFPQILELRRFELEESCKRGGIDAS